MICYYTYLFGKTIMVNCFRPCSIPDVSLLMLLYLCSALVRLLLAYVMDLRMVLSEEIPFRYVVTSLVCNSMAPSPILHASVLRYRGFVSS